LWYLETSNHGQEILVNLFDRGRQGFAFGTTYFNLGQFGELYDGLGQIKDIMATLQETIQSHEQGIVLDLPGIRRTFGISRGFVFQICGFEGTTHVQRGLKHGYGLMRFFTFDHRKNLLTTNIFGGLQDQTVANLPHQHHYNVHSIIVIEVSRCIIM